MATGLTHGEPDREADEFVDVVIVRLSDALELSHTGRLIHGKTGLGLLSAAAFQRGVH